MWMSILSIVSGAFFQAILKGITDALSRPSEVMAPTTTAPLPPSFGPSGTDLVNKWGRV